MIDKLDKESRNSLIIYRLERAFETLKEADYNAKGKYFNNAVNRLYYSAFYAAIALLLSKEIDCGTHQGVRNMLSLQFVKTGFLDPKYGKIFQQLFQNRLAGDYEDFVYCDEELYNMLRPQAEEFVRIINDLLTKQS